MIRLKKGINEVFVTLYERGVTSSVYTVKVSNSEQRSVVKELKAKDITPNGKRVNVLEIEVVENSNDEDLNEGKIYLTGGDYLYDIFDENNTFVEKGIIKFDTQPTSTTYGEDTLTEKVYNG